MSMSKIKIVQIESFYNNFLKKLYGANPVLESMTYDYQLQALLNSGWSSGQNVVPHLNPSKFESYYIIPSHVNLQMRWAKEKGINSEGMSKDQILLYQLEFLKPDIIYLSDIPCFNFEILDLLTKKPFVVAWHATALSNTINWPSIDLLLSGIDKIRERAMELGVKATEEFMSGSPNYRNQDAPLTLPPENDICFSGSFIDGLHDQRAQLFLEISKHIAPYKIDIFSSNKFTESSNNIRFFPAVYAAEVVNIYSKYKIVIDARANFGLSEDLFEAQTSNMRVFEATRAGALLLTQNSSNINKYFNIDSEIITYRNNKEFIEKILFYSNPKNEQLRSSIAEMGYSKSIKLHSIEQRALWFENIISKFA